MRHMPTGDHLARGIDRTQDPLAGALGIYSTNRATNPRNIGGDEGYYSRSTRLQAHVDRTRLAGPAGAGGEGEAAAAATVTATTPAGDVIIRMSAAAMAAATPDAAALDALFPGARIVSITARAVGAATDAPASGFGAGSVPPARLARADVVSRCFARGVEDPVCAAAHAGLAQYWATAPDAPAALAAGGTLRAFQSSPLGGELRVDIDCDAASGAPQWVRLAGACATMVDGALAEEALAELFAAD